MPILLLLFAVPPIEDAWAGVFPKRHLVDGAGFESCKDSPKLSPLVREKSWTNNLLIMTACKTDEAMEFYIRACIENRYSKRKLELQILACMIC